MSDHIGEAAKLALAAIDRGDVMEKRRQLERMRLLIGAQFAMKNLDTRKRH